jgi:hypothetical protein
MTRTNPRSKFIRLIVLIVLPLISCTYASFAGGDHYKIYLNKKLVAEQFVARSTSALNLQLNESNYNDEITVYYSHCGVTGKSRTIKLKDDKGNILKEWKFNDGENNDAMTIAAKEVLQLEKGHGTLNLYYAAKELPNGRMLASVNLGNKIQFLISRRRDQIIHLLALLSRH